MKAKVILSFMVVLIELASISCPFVSSLASITICVAPSYVSVGVFELFSVNIDIADVSSPGLFGYQVMLCFDVDCLEAISAEIPDGHFFTPTSGVPPGIFIVWPGVINNTLGTVSFAATLLVPEEGKTGSGTLARVQFRAIAAGNSSLTLRDVILVDPDATPTPANLEDGNVSVGAGSGRPSIYMSPKYKSVEIGETFPVSIKVANMPSPGLFNHQVMLCFDVDCLEAISAEMPDGHFLTPTTPSGLLILDLGTINNTLGTVSFAATLLAPEEGKTGSGTLARVQFRAIAAGNSSLTLADVIFMDSDSNKVQVEVEHSSVDIAPVSCLTKVCVNPQRASVVIDNLFWIGIDILHVPWPGLFSYELELYYNSSVLEATIAEIPEDHFLNASLPESFLIRDPGTINNTLGTVSFAATLLAPEEGKTGSGTLARVQFRAIAAGNSSLTLADVILTNPDDEEVSADQYIVENGSIDVLSGPPTVYVNVQYSSIEVDVPFSVDVNIADIPLPGLIGGELKLCYDTDCLEAISAEMPDGHFLTPATPGGLFVVHPGTIDNAAGKVLFAAILLPPEDSKTGSGTLMTVQFRAIATGNTTFQLEDVILVGPSAGQGSPLVYESKTNQSPVVTLVPEFSLPIILSTFAAVALLTLLVWRRKQLWLK